MDVRTRILLVGLTVAAAGCATAPQAESVESNRGSDVAAEHAGQFAPHDMGPSAAANPSAGDTGHSRIVLATSDRAADPLALDREHAIPPHAASYVAVHQASPVDKSPVEAGDQLDPDQLVADVLAVNPSVDAMISAWRAAMQRYPQVTALDDPMFQVALGPNSWNERNIDSAYMVMASQKFPWPGKLELQGAVANAEANAASRNITDVRLQLAELTRLSYVDYWQAHRERQLNAENIREMREFRETAEAKLRASLVTQQDVLQADVELALLERRRLEIDRRSRVATARINTLLHRAAQHPLPLPPEQFAGTGDLPPVEALVAIALENRPDLAMQVDRIQADRAQLALACKDYYPDFDAYAKYDAFWQEKPLRPMIGVSLNVPLNRDRRRAAVREAESTLHRHSAEYARLSDEVANEVHSLVEHWREANGTVQLYQSQIIPAATKNVASAQAGYVSGRVDFLRLIEAQRQLIDLREREVAAEASLLSRAAELQRAAALPLSE